MKKAFTGKAFFFFTLLFVFFATVSFVAFQETKEVCLSNTCKAAKSAGANEMIWEVVSRRILSLVSI